MSRPSETMPCDESLLIPIGRVTWAAIRLHHGIRDKIGLLGDSVSDKPFKKSLGGAKTQLRKLASTQEELEIVSWCDDIAEPAIEGRNGLLHAIGYTHPEGRQALQGSEENRSRDYTIDEILDIADSLVEASRMLPK